MTNPQWPPLIKRIAIVAILILFIYVLYLARILILPVLISMVLAYILLPVVQYLHWQMRLPRPVALGVVYTLVIAVIIAIPAWFTPSLVRQVNWFIANIPTAIEQLLLFADQPIEILGRQTLIISDVVPLETVVNNILSYVPSVGFQSVNLFGSVASITLLTVGWVAFCLFISFYMVRDYEQFLRGLISVVPEEYEWEMYQLAYEISRVWNSFLRGQLLLLSLMATVVFIVGTILGLPNALLLGLIAGTAELLPQIGPFFMLIPTVLIAFFQHDQSWLGNDMSAIGFAITVGIIYLTMNQLASYFVTPRILGRSLNMHPAIVFCAALAGASIAGILGILLASPVLASGRVVVRYVYCKLRDIPPYPDRYDPGGEPVPIIDADDSADSVPSAGVASTLS